MVFPSFRSRFDSGDPKIFAPNMALALAAATLLALLAFCLAFASLGSVLLRFFRLEMEFSAEHLLIAIAVGLIATEILLFFVQITEHIRLGSLAVTAFLFCLLLWNWAPVWERLKITLRQIAPLSLLTKFLLTILAVVASVEFLSALAPLTGSDALQYHFAVQKEILEHGFHPLFSNSHSFMCGQHHLLILLGLALGSEKLALGFIYLGGILTAAAFAGLASRWASHATITSFALIFLLTPVVFWQMTSSGSPDIYMAFLASTAMIVLGRINTTQVWRQLLLAGFLVGGIAGAKYTGCFISAAIALAVVIEFPILLSASAFRAGSLASGIWP